MNVPLAVGIGISGFVVLWILIYWMFIRQKPDADRSSKNQILQDSEYGDTPRHSSSSSVVDTRSTSVGISEPVQVGPTEEELKVRLAAATTEEECLDVYQDAPAGSDIEREAIRRHSAFLSERLSRATTVEECEDARESIILDDESTLTETEIDQKISAILETDLASALTIDACQTVLDAITGDDFEEKGELAKRAVRKMIELSTTHHECIEIFDELPGDVDADLLDQILRTALERAETSQQCTDVLDRVDEGVYGPDDDEIGNRQVELSTTVDECAELWGSYDDLEGDVARAAICKAAEIIRAEQSTAA